MAFLLFILIGSRVSGSTAGLVVVHGDGTTVVKVVEFSEPSLSGTELLTRCGLSNSIVNGSVGQAVYMIDGEGNPTGWVTQNGKSYYWSFFVQKNGVWEYSKVGAGSATVKNGDVQGWMWQFYGQNAGFPAVAIPETNVEVVAGQTGTAATSVAATSAAKKPITKLADNNTRVVNYAVFALIMLVLGTAAALLIRFRGR